MHAPTTPEPKLAALCDLVDVASVLRMAIWNARRRRGRAGLVDLQRGLDATNRAKAYLHEQIHGRKPEPDA